MKAQRLSVSQALSRHKWVSDKLHLIDAGDARRVIRTLLKYRGQGQKRIANLFEHMQRFVDAVDYDYCRAMGLPIGSGEVESAIALHSSKASQDSRGNMASRYHQSHAGKSVLFEPMIGGRIFGGNNQLPHLIT